MHLTHPQFGLGRRVCTRCSLSIWCSPRSSPTCACSQSPSAVRTTRRGSRRARRRWSSSCARATRVAFARRRSSGRASTTRPSSIVYMICSTATRASSVRRDTRRDARRDAQRRSSWALTWRVCAPYAALALLKGKRSINDDALHPDEARRQADRLRRDGKSAFIEILAKNSAAQVPTSSSTK